MYWTIDFNYQLIPCLYGSSGYRGSYVCILSRDSNDEESGNGGEFSEEHS